MENADIMTRRLTRDIFITKDDIWDDMLPLLLILSRCELESWINLSHEIFFLKGHFYDEGRYKGHNCKTALVSPNRDKIRLVRKIDYKDL